MYVVTSIRDRVADRYLGLQLCENDKVACRGFVDAMADVRSDGFNLLVSHPEDFELWYLGQFDEFDGVFSDGDHAHILMQGSTARRQLDSYGEGDLLDTEIEF